METSKPEDKKLLIEWKAEEKNIIVSKPLKYTLVFISFFIWLCGCLIAAVGGWMIAQDYDYAIIAGFFMTPAAFFAGIGCFVFVISGFGVMGSYRENIRCLRIFKYSLVLVLVLTLCACMIGFAFWPEMKKILDKEFRVAIRKYYDSPIYKDMIDGFQRDLECCGSLSIDDWDSNPYLRCRKRGSYRSCGVPWSCCLPFQERNFQCGNRIRKNKIRRGGRPLSADIWTVGCLDKGFEYLIGNMHIIGGFSMGAVLLVLTTIYMCHVLVKQIRKQIRVYNEANDIYNFNAPIPDPGFIGTESVSS